MRHMVKFDETKTKQYTRIYNRFHDSSRFLLRTFIRPSTMDSFVLHASSPQPIKGTDGARHSFGIVRRCSSIIRSAVFEALQKGRRSIDKRYSLPINRDCTRCRCEHGHHFIPTICFVYTYLSIRKCLRGSSQSERNREKKRLFNFINCKERYK